jgi:hypothetical protein
MRASIQLSVKALGEYIIFNGFKQQFKAAHFDLVRLDLSLFRNPWHYAIITTSAVTRKVRRGFRRQ